MFAPAAHRERCGGEFTATKNTVPKVASPLFFFSLLLMYATNLAHMAVMDENERPVELHLMKN